MLALLIGKLLQYAFLLLDIPFIRRNAIVHIPQPLFGHREAPLQNLQIPPQIRQPRKAISHA